MLNKFVRLVGGDPNQREIEKLSEIAEIINEFEGEYEILSNEALSAKTVEFRQRLARSETLDDILVEAFAVVREVSKRKLGLRHYDVQMIGGVALHQGKIIEMRTGEGKTLVATLPLYLNALTLHPDWIALAESKWGSDPESWQFEPIDGFPVGLGTHLITVNDYLARRDARWMAPIYNMLGLEVGVLQMAARTESGKKAFLIDMEKESPHEDQHQLQMVPRAMAYAADITYGTNSEFGFDYLRDNMTMRLEDRVQRGHHYAIIDEVDNVLIDEARTPLIISGPAQDEAEWYIRMAQVVKQLRPEDYEVDEKAKSALLTEIGEAHIEEILDMPLRDPDRPEDLTMEQTRILGYMEQAMRAQFLFKRNKEYLVQSGKVVIVDEFTGRMMPGRRWSDGLHQAIEAKEGVKVESESVTYATITIQNYFRMYEKLAGMTGTAVTEAEEFHKIYDLDVIAIPTNLEYEANSPESGLEQLEDRDEAGYKFTYYAQQDDPEKTPVFWKRKDFPDVVYRTLDAKLRAIALEILRYHVMGRPILVGTTSVELSDLVSSRLRSEPIRRIAQVNLIRDAWQRQNDYVEDGRAIPELAFLNPPIEQLNPGEMRSMARDLNISFNPEEPNNLNRLISLLKLSEIYKDRLVSALQGGIPHEVLNARKHTEESQIIAGAGAFGAVTIATNMAGRGVDIKLGGELAEEILTIVNRVLNRAGYDDPYNMTMEERREAINSLDMETIGIYESEVKYFFRHMEEMEMVRDLGGLHVIGSERHEARRIDNQLRGRSARQGDPGSSRFYLSMEDELMRLFGGQQADSLMQRMNIDDALPLEMGLVGRLVEQSQTRVEGANFDVRKHLLEYDDVLNTQRARIYSQRDRIFTKDDLTEDVTELLRAEVTSRVPEALGDEGGPWKLLSWLDQIQPTIVSSGEVFPSFTLRILMDDIESKLDLPAEQSAVKEALLDIAAESLAAEKEYLLSTVHNLLLQSEIRLEGQIEERMDSVDTYFEGLTLQDETDNRRPAQILSELSELIRLPVKLPPSEANLLLDDPYDVYDDIRQQITTTINSQTISRLIGAIERRLEITLEINPSQLPEDDWNSMADAVLEAVENALTNKAERLLGNNGSLTNDLDTAISKLQGQFTEPVILRLLMLLPQGTRSTFDKKTHRRVIQSTTRMTYTFFAAQLLEGVEPEEISADVLAHLENAQEIIRNIWGNSELKRLGNTTPAELGETFENSILAAIEESPDSPFAQRKLADFPPEVKATVSEQLGRMALTAIYRQLLLRVITELWVEYLTQMEALRISIGLEAYARQDPLVQYKNRAFELFQNLLRDMRLSVVSRMFTYRPQDSSIIQAAASQAETQRADLDNGVDSEQEGEPALVTDGSPIRTEKEPEQKRSSKKRRRRRRRK